MSFLFALLLPAVLQEPAVVYRGARLHTGEGAPLDRGDLIVRGRVIEAVGADLPLPEGAKVVDLGGKVIVPGYIDSAGRAFLDPADRGPGSPEQDVADALDFFRPEAAELAARGVTTLYVTPSGAGLGAVLHLASVPSILRRRAALHLPLSRGGDLSTAAGRHEAYRQLVQLFEGAQAHREAGEKYAREKKEHEARKSAGEKGLKEPSKPARDAAKDVLGLALAGVDPLPVRLEAHAADSIGYALRLATDFKLRLVLEGVTEGFECAEALSRSKAALVVGPLLRYGPPTAESLRHRGSCAAALAKAGVGILAIGSFGRDAGASRFLPEAAGAAASRGLDRGRALEAVTIGAARALGLDGEIGSLKKGKRADFLVLSGDPFDARTIVERTFVDGVAVHGRAP